MDPREKPVGDMLGCALGGNLTEPAERIYQIAFSNVGYAKRGFARRGLARLDGKGRALCIGRLAVHCVKHFSSLVGTCNSAISSWMTLIGS